MIDRAAERRVDADLDEDQSDPVGVEHDDAGGVEHLLSSYRYELPEELIATRPPDERGASRLLVLRRNDDTPTDRTFRDLDALLDEGDCLVVNDTRVVPARLMAERAQSGGKVEIVLGPARDDGTYTALLSPAKKMRPGERLVLGGRDGGFDEPFFATVQARLHDEPGAFAVAFEGDPLRFARELGEIPLPPYMKRAADDDDDARYQTVYAHPEKWGASAAPTAGLHFTHAHLAALKRKGVRVAAVTLHVGPGTFLPVRTDDVREHQMHVEPWSIDVDAARTLNETRLAQKRIVAVGTTALRTLESAIDSADDVFVASRGRTRLFIRPGYAFKCVDALITNFHLPESTLLMLVSAFVGRERALAAYAHAVTARYRFFSYGDACFFERRTSTDSATRDA